MSITTNGIVHDKQGRRYISAPEAAHRLGVLTQTVHARYRRGVLRGARIGTSNAIHVLEADVERALTAPTTRKSAVRVNLHRPPTISADSVIRYSGRPSQTSEVVDEIRCLSVAHPGKWISLGEGISPGWATSYARRGFKVRRVTAGKGYLRGKAADIYVRWPHES